MQWNRAPHCEFNRKSMETQKKTLLEFPNGAEAIVEQMLVSEEINKSKRAELWESQSKISKSKISRKTIK